MMKTHQLLFVLLGFLSAHIHVDAYVLGKILSFFFCDERNLSLIMFLFINMIAGS